MESKLQMRSLASTAPTVQQELLSINTREVKLTADIGIDDSLVVGRRNNHRMVIFDLGGNSITMSDPTKPPIVFEAATQNDAAINTSTIWVIINGKIIGGSHGVYMKGGYQGIIAGVQFFEQSKFSARVEFCLQTTFERCMFYNPHENGLFIGRGSWGGASPSNSQSNMTVVSRCHFKGKGDQSKTMLEINSSSQCAIEHCIIEGGSNEYGIKFTGVSTHTRLLFIYNLWVETICKEAAIYSEILGNVSVNGISTQHAQCLFDVQKGHLEINHAQQIHAGCWGVTNYLQTGLNIKNSAVVISKPEFWRDETGEVRFPKRTRIEFPYGSDQPDTETGTDETDTETNPLDIATAFGANEHAIDVAENYGIVCKFSIPEFINGNTIVSLGTYVRSANGYPLVRVYGARHGDGRATIHLNLNDVYKSQTDGQFIATGIEPGQEYILYLHKADKLTIGLYGGNVREYNLLPSNGALTHICGLCFVNPNRQVPQGVTPGEFEGYYLPDADLSTLYEICEFVKNN